MQSVTVRVPATSANIGPGFDSLGCALTLYNTFTFTRASVIAVSGCEAAYANENNLALVAFRRTCESVGVTPPAVSLHIAADVPVSRGLGSSATLLVGGAVAANHLCDLHLDKQALFRIANDLEGHPDNVAPALFGGFTASLLDGGVPYTSSVAVHPSYRFCAFVPDFETSTHDARRVLPETVPYADAVFNGSHVAVLLAALSSGDTKLLRTALHDRLHEPYRLPLIHEFDKVRDAAFDAGAHAFFLSGSGSTCMAICTDADFPAAVAPALASLSHNWRVLPLALDLEGARRVISE